MEADVQLVLGRWKFRFRVVVEREASLLDRLRAGAEELFAQGHATVSVPDLVAHTGINRCKVQDCFCELTRMPDVEFAVIEQTYYVNGQQQTLGNSVLRRKNDQIGCIEQYGEP
ncbi:MAG: hypothetical protein EI684_10465 [Candidatus Viridilinea halotolerans]|uniref:Uncharacterized protein n=1 Tax=Candidatus Viridilinea halotolerans TaxID=2491704 RepID=A0A426U058_9CHLR|nr:MAG: hypothetical protein EI684_10465 [Candidatus Viridilinea halotolerans]